MKKSDVSIQQVAPTRTFFEFVDRNQKGEKITIEIIECEAGKEQKKMGFPERWLSVKTYIEKPDGSCNGGYNPFIERYEHGFRVVPERLLPTSENNKYLILEMVRNLAFS